MKVGDGITSLAACSERRRTLGDKAKKEFAVDSVAELKKLRDMYGERDEIGRQIKPNFFGKIARYKGYYDSNRKNYKFHDTTMDYIQHTLNKGISSNFKGKLIPFSNILVDDTECETKIKYTQIDDTINMVREMWCSVRAVWDCQDGLTTSEKVELTKCIREDFKVKVRAIKFNANTAKRLLVALEEEQNRDVARPLFSILFSLPNSSFFSLLEERRENVHSLSPCNEGTIEIHGKKYAKVSLE